MFIENLIQGGWIEVIAGSMFSGKTEELLRRIKRAKIAQQDVLLFKPKIDDRYSQTNVVSHDSNRLISIPVENSEDILTYIDNCQVVGIDEAQFFDVKLPEVCNILADRGIRVIIAGLDMDFKGKPFGVMPELMAIAEYLTKVHAICVRCGHLANHSHRLTPDKSLVLLGEKSEYQAICRNCFNKAVK